MRGHAAPGDPRLADVPGPLALEPQPGAARPALPERPQEPAADPAHGGRRPHGRAVPAGRGLPGERHRPDRDPRPPARAPDDQRHAAPRRSTSTASAACSSGSSRGDGARCTASTPPRRRCSRTRSSPPGRTRSSTTRSSRTGARTRCSSGAGLNVDLAAIGALEPDAIERVRDEVTPEPDDRRRPPRPPELAGAHPGPRRLAAALGRAGRARAAARCSSTTGTSCGAPPSAVEDARARARRRRAPRSRRRSAGTSRSPGSPPSTRSPRRPRSPPSRVAAGLAVLQNEGFALQGRYTGGEDDRVGRPPAAGPHALVLAADPARHAPDRSPPQDFMRFLLRWQHVAPGTQLAGEAGLLAALDQLQGFEAAAVAWEPELLAPAHARATGPSCSTSSATRARSAGCGSRPGPRDDADAPVGQPSKATPISVVFRADTPWLLAAARGGRRPARADRRRDGRDPRGAARARRELLAPSWRLATRRLPEDVERGALGRRRPRPAHRRRLRRGPHRRSSGSRASTTRAASPGCCAAPAAATAAVGPLVAGAATARRRTSTATSWPRRSPSCCCAAGA